MPPSVLDTAGLQPFFIEATAEWQLLPPPAGAKVLTPADLEAGASEREIAAWFAPHASVPTLMLGDLAGRGERGTGSDAAAAAVGGATSSIAERLDRGVVFREEILRHVSQQVQAATPFDCLCLQHDGADLAQNASAIAADFATRVHRSRTVFVAAYRVDLVGLDAFHDVWKNVYALALYDWNGQGLQGRQFSSAINRLVCKQAEAVHSWHGRVEASGECW